MIYGNQYGMTIQRYSELLNLEKKYNDTNTDRNTLIKFVKEILPVDSDIIRQLDGSVGHIENDLLLAMHSSVYSGGIEMRKEIDGLNEKITELTKINKQLIEAEKNSKLTIKKHQQKALVLEEELKKKVSVESDAYLKKLKSYASTNQDTNKLEFLEEKNKSQAELITSLRSQLSIYKITSIESTENKDSQVQTDPQLDESVDRILQLNKSLEDLQNDYNVLYSKI